MEKRTRSKKFATGCALAAGIALVLLLGVATAMYFAVRHVTGPLFYLSAGSVLEKKSVATSPFRPPTNGELTSGQLAAFLSVENAVQARLGARLADLRARSDALIGKSHEGRDSLSLRPTLDALGPIGPAFLDGKRAQIDALNRAGMSRDEFEWVRQQLYHAAGIEAWQFDFSDVLAGVPDAEIVLRPLPRGTEVPSANRSLVAAHAGALQRWSALASFGL